MTSPTTTRNKRLPLTLALLALVALCCLPLTATAEADDVTAVPPTPEAQLRSWFGGIELGEPVQAGPLTVIPLLRAKPIADDMALTSRTVPLKATLLSVERRSATVQVHNTGETAVLLSAGQIVRDGISGADHVIAHDAILAPGATTEVRALPSSFTPGEAVEGHALTLSPHAAPPSLREELMDDADSYDVKTYLSLFREVVGEDEDRIPSLHAVLGSGFARALDEEVMLVSKDPVWRSERLSGFATGIYGRTISIQLFATPRLTREMMTPILKAHGIRAAALSVRGEDLGVPMARGDDARDRVVEETRTSLARMAKRTRLLSEDAPIMEFRSGSASGHGVWHGSKAAHVVVYPHDPYERALFRRTFEALDELDSDRSAAPEAAQGELERSVRRGTATEYEKRLAERRRRLRRGR
jgi:hypothetical protein